MSRSKNIKIKLASLHESSEIILEGFTHLGRVKIGPHRLNIGAYSYMRGGGSIDTNCSIGRFCSIAKDVTLGLDGTAHPLDWVSTSPFQYDSGFHNNSSEKLYDYKAQIADHSIIIGNDVWIGSGVTIMNGVKIGTGAVIAANSFVTKDVPAYAIVGGVPGRIIKYRFDDATVKEMLETQWWDYSVKDILGLPVNKPEQFLSLFFENKFHLKNKVEYLKYKVLPRRSLLRRKDAFSIKLMEKQG